MPRKLLGWMSILNVSSGAEEAGARRASRDQDRGGDDGGPDAVLVSHRGLRHVDGLVELAADLPDFLPFIVRLVRVELDAENGGQHLRGEILGVIPGLVLRLS